MHSVKLWVAMFAALNTIMGIGALLNPSRSETREVSLEVGSVKSEYVVREPVKFIVKLINESPQPVNIPEPHYFDMNMRFLLLEVTSPNGELQVRRFQYVSTLSLVNYQYTGEPLASGEMIETYLYPNVTYPVDLPSLSPADETHITFPEPGRYGVRVIYHVDPAMENLWKGPKGDLYSNRSTLQFRKPTASEEEILAALWVDGGYELSVGDTKTISSFDEIPLRRVIDDYPQHPMTDYARLALARTLMVLSESTTRAELSEAAEILEWLMENSVDIRPREVRQLLGEAYSTLGLRDKAVALFSETLRIHPELQDNFHFMQLLIVTKTGSVEATSEWIESRKSGDKRIFEEFE